QRKFLTSIQFLKTEQFSATVAHLRSGGPAERTRGEATGISLPATISASRAAPIRWALSTLDELIRFAARDRPLPATCPAPPSQPYYSALDGRLRKEGSSRIAQLAMLRDDDPNWHCRHNPTI